MTHLRWVPPRRVPIGTMGAALRRYDAWSDASRLAGYPSEGWVTPPCIWTFLSSLEEGGFFSVSLDESEAERSSRGEASMKKKYRIGVIPGDGIGRDVIKAAQVVLDAVDESHGP